MAAGNGGGRRRYGGVPAVKFSGLGAIFVRGGEGKCGGGAGLLIGPDGGENHSLNGVNRRGKIAGRGCHGRMRDFGKKL